MKKNQKTIINAKRTTIKEWFQKNLATIRGLSGITLSDIASNTGISVQTLSLLENGKRKISIYQYIVIRQYIECRLTYKLNNISYAFEDMDDYDTIINDFIDCVLYIAISMICNDRNIWSENEKTFLIQQWEQMKVAAECEEDAVTAKTYNRKFIERLTESIKEHKENILYIYYKEMIENPNIFEGEIDDAVNDLIKLLSENEDFSPEVKLLADVLFNVIFVSFITVPYDELWGKIKIKEIRDIGYEFAEILNGVDLRNIPKETMDKLEEKRDSIYSKYSYDVAEDEKDFIVINNLIFMHQIKSSEEIDNFYYNWLSVINSLAEACLSLIRANDWYFSMTYMSKEVESKSLYEHLIDIYPNRCFINVDKFGSIIKEYEEENMISTNEHAE